MATDNEIRTVPRRQKAAGPASDKPKESKADRFKRLASKRVAKALKALDGVRALASTASYEYTPEQADKIGAALSGALAGIKAAYSGERKATSVFTL